MTDLTMEKGNPYPMGVSFPDGGVNIAIEDFDEEPVFLLLYDRESGRRVKKLKIPKNYRTGNVLCVRLCGFLYEQYEYNFSRGETRFVDPYAKRLSGCSKWGERRPRGILEPDKITLPGWEDDRPLELPYEDVVMYLLHVRGFTKHKSSGVAHPGCFEGIVEKIPYLKDLGINQIELMPAYDFSEVMRKRKNSTELPALTEEKNGNRMNYWGYCDAFYFSPKASYSGTGNPQESFRALVMALHEAGIEVVMQFYFPEDKSPVFMIECLRYWVLTYHIDGVHLLGNQIFLEAFVADPILGRTKISWEKNGREPKKAKGSFRRLASYDDGYMYDMRRFLKSDENMLRAFTGRQNYNSNVVVPVNYITNYYGFTMMDLVSYDYKHNEANGEDNRDGNECNCSWNCGAEGRTRRRQVMRLRKRQIRNAFCMLLFSQGVPLILSGDEFGNSQRGNNNPYCQDNEISWLNWENIEGNRDIFDFVKALIALRKEHTIFHRREQPRIMDTKSCGYPDISYHGEMAWYPKFENYNRHIAVMYCGEYAEDGRREDDFYIIYNMYWLDTRFALPKLPKDREWCLLLDTGTGFEEDEKALPRQNEILVKDRKIVVLRGKKKE